MATKANSEAADKTAVSSVSEEAKKVEKVAKENALEVVHLIGSASQKTGHHGIWADGKLLADFVDGVAKVTPDVAKALKAIGVAE